VKVALYARVSKSDETQNPENQFIRLRNYAQDQGYEVYEEYVDKASGADPNRPYLDKMLNDAKAHRFKVVLTVKLDRIARSIINFYTFLNQLNSAKVEFQCIDQPDISTTSSTGKLLMALLGAIAEFERDLIRERVNAGLARAKAEGRRFGRPPKAFDLKTAISMKAEGKSLGDIAKATNVSKATVINRLRKEGVGSPKE
jgi:DNA invertase Pin-like site-specific DNA recombinase